MRICYNIYTYSSMMRISLSNFVSKTVVIHSDHVVIDKEGQSLKQQLEEITGLQFTTQN